jgi:hypothetical protein
VTFDERLDSDEPAGAFDVCTQFVEDRLTSPGSAQFPDFFEDDGEVTVTITRAGNYRITSQVDSENSFGALLRAYFDCTVRPLGGGEWQLVDLVII